MNDIKSNEVTNYINDNSETLGKYVLWSIVIYKGLMILLVFALNLYAGRFSVITLIIWYIILHNLVKGKEWARVTFIILGGLGAILEMVAFFGLIYGDMSALLGEPLAMIDARIIYGLIVLLDMLVVICLMFYKPVKEYLYDRSTRQ
jgi:hypothetical protein